jgi:hypothetical protein
MDGAGAGVIEGVYVGPEGQEIFMRSVLKI